MLALFAGACATGIGPGDPVDGTATTVGATEALACEAATLMANNQALKTRDRVLDHDNRIPVVRTSRCRCLRVSNGAWSCAVDYRND